MVKRIRRAHSSASQLGRITYQSTLNEEADAARECFEHPKIFLWPAVFDNYDNPRMAGNTELTAVDIRPFLSEADHGAIFVTTRSSRVEIGHSIRLRKLAVLGMSVKILS